MDHIYAYRSLLSISYKIAKLIVSFLLFKNSQYWLLVVLLGVVDLHRDQPITRIIVWLRGQYLLDWKDY